VVKDLICDGFQDTVRQLLIRHRSVLDVMSKMQDATARVNRAMTKSVTNCGCVEISASKQKFPASLDSLSEVRSHMATHLSGSMCEVCREVLETEIGGVLFYLTALCSVTGLDLQDVLWKEHTKLQTLGVFNLS